MSKGVSRRTGRLNRTSISFRLALLDLVIFAGLVAVIAVALL